MGKKRQLSAKLILLFLFLNLFFLSISLMGAFKGQGKDFARGLIESLYQNPFLGLLIGILVTGIMQSSSATTSIVVSLVATGLFGTDPERALFAAIPIIMGANIGTSITNTIVAMGHISNEREFRRAFSAATVHDFFNFITVIIVFPLQLFTNFLGIAAGSVARLFTGVSAAKFNSPLKAIIKPQEEFITSLFQESLFVPKLVMCLILSYILFLLISFFIKEIISNGKKIKIYVVINSIYLGVIAFVILDYPGYIFHKNLAVFSFALLLLFTSLTFFVKIMKNLTTGTLELLFNQYIFKNAIRAFTLGIILTAIIQSSSVTTSIVVPLAGAGILNINQIFPYTLGANIGTTITAMLAALSLGNVTSLSVAFAHLFFNILGTSLVYPFKQLPIMLANKFAGLILVNRILPVIIILSVYILLPFICIVLFS